jgi:hypothetical protein
MFFTYHRVGKIPVLPALAAAGALVIVGGIAVTIAVTTLAIVGVVAGSVRLLRTLGLAPAERRLAFQDHETIEGVVVNRSQVGTLDP